MKSRLIVTIALALVVLSAVITLVFVAITNHDDDNDSKPSAITNDAFTVDDIVLERTLEGKNGVFSVEGSLDFFNCTGNRSVDNCEYIGAQFLGIPYTAPKTAATGERMMPAVAGSYDFATGSTFDATSKLVDLGALTGGLVEGVLDGYTPMCIQSDGDIADLRAAGIELDSEDCLTLNVYVPGDVPLNTTGSGRPVNVWIYGGAFMNGYSMNGTARWTVNDLPAGERDSENVPITVAINYRVGAWGFMHHQDLPKNSSTNAIGDCIAALQWIQANIASFGGDPSRVTIMGESAGASAVMFLWTSPAAQGLFSGVVAQSDGVEIFQTVDVSTLPYGITGQDCMELACRMSGTDNCTVNAVPIWSISMYCRSSAKWCDDGAAPLTNTSTYAQYCSDGSTPTEYYILGKSQPEPDALIIGSWIADGYNVNHQTDYCQTENIESLVPLLIGHNSFELDGFTNQLNLLGAYNLVETLSPSMEACRDDVYNFVPLWTEDIFEKLNPQPDASAFYGYGYTFGQVMSAIAFAPSPIFLANHGSKVYSYLFNQEKTGVATESADCPSPWPMHGCEVSFIIRSDGTGFGNGAAAAFAYAEQGGNPNTWQQMREAWSSFIVTGKPTWDHGEVGWIDDGVIAKPFPVYSAGVDQALENLVCYNKLNTDTLNCTNFVQKALA